MEEKQRLQEKALIPWWKSCDLTLFSVQVGNSFLCMEQMCLRIQTDSTFHIRCVTGRSLKLNIFTRIRQ